MTWCVRPATPEDWPILATIRNQRSLRSLSTDDFIRQERERSQQEPWVRLVAYQPDDVIAGHCVLFRNPWRPVGTYFLEGAVDEAHGRMGAGAALLAAAEQQARQWGQSILELEVRDDRPEGLAFLAKHGFQPIQHFLRSEIDLERFDPEPHRAPFLAAQRRGYRFLSLAHLDPAEGKRRVYQLDIDCARDEPGLGPDWTPLSYEAYAAELFDSPNFDPAGLFLAEKDGELVAMNGLHFPGGGAPAWTFFTGVRRDHRGQGLAQALKLLGLEYARQKGYRRVGTSNHERNGAMLAVNRKFGFTPAPGIIAYQKRL